MMNAPNRISPTTARKILLEAENNGVSVEDYLKNLAEDFDDNGKKNFSVKIARIDYDFAKSKEWLEKNAEKYVGKWIVLDGEKLVGFGKNPVLIVEKARKEGVKIPFVRFIDDNSKPFMGGWL